MKCQYAAPAHTNFFFSSPVEGEALFLPALKRLQTLYPVAYARGSTSTHEGAEPIVNLNAKMSARTHPGAAGLIHSWGEVTPPPPDRHH